MSSARKEVREKGAVLGERSDAYLVQNPNLKVNKNNTVCPQN